MKRILFGFCVSLIIIACGNRKNIPDVSNISIDLQVQRFEQDFFSLDTTNMDQALEDIHEKYTSFLQDFVFNILSDLPDPDTVQRDIKEFISSYQFLYDSSQKVFQSVEKEAAVVKRGLQFVKYYFPDYELPNKFITFIGPLNSFSNVITQDALAVGLQTYLGRNFSLYHSQAGQQLYPAFVSRRFERQYMPVNSIKNIVDDLSENVFENSSTGRPLIEQMVEAGRRLYLLDHFLPEVADTLKTGYTQAQLQGAIDNERAIWAHFLNSNHLFTTDPNITRDYMNDAPNTTALGPNSPGFIGQFVGWQIVKKFVSRKENISLEELMKIPARQIFEEAKYKP